MRTERKVDLSEIRDTDKLVLLGQDIDGESFVFILNGEKVVCTIDEWRASKRCAICGKKSDSPVLKANGFDWTCPEHVARIK
jgi:hypothetical protein